MNKTPIEWTDFTVNPIRFRNLANGKVGHHCVKISPGYKNCYASTMQAGPYLSGLTYIEENRPKGEFFFDDAVLKQVLRRKKPCRIFWADMTDLFGEWVPDEWIDRCFAVMALTPHLTHQVLTKRAERMRQWCQRLQSMADAWSPQTVRKQFTPSDVLNFRHMHETFGRGPAFPYTPWPLSNVWLGVSVENQQYADERIPLLLQTPAAVRFVSAEPLLGPVDLGLNRWVRLPHTVCSELPWEVTNEGRAAFPGAYRADVNPHGALFVRTASGDLLGIKPGEFERLPKLNWVIVGGESGPGARPFDIAWARSILQQCRSANEPAFMKQVGAKPGDSASPDYQQLPAHQRDSIDTWLYGGLKLKDRKGGNPEEWPEDLRVREMPA